MRKPRIFLADDHILLLDAFRRLLENEFEIVGTATDGLELLESAQSLRPDLVVVDLGLPLLNGVDAGRELKKLLPQTKILVVTVNESSALADAVLGEWASGTVEEMHGIGIGEGSARDLDGPVLCDDDGICKIHG